jgi:guanylate kinase
MADTAEASTVPPILTPDGRPRRGRLFVVSGPSGVGKDTVLEHVLPHIPNLLLNISATTRSPRPGESEGKPYFFVPMADFRTLVEQNAFLEYAHVNGNFYGTPQRWVDEQRQLGNDVLLKIDVQGGLTIRTKVRDAVLLFLMPPSFDELERRLRARSTETEEQITTRLLDSRSEMQQMPNYDYVVVNDQVSRAADLVRAIILAERCRIQHDASASTQPSVPWTPPA